MNFTWKSAAVLSLLSLIPWSGSAQVEKISDAMYRDSLKQFPIQEKAAKNPYLKDYLKSLNPQKMDEMAFVTATRVAADLNKNPDFKGKVAYYAVPAMSRLEGSLPVTVMAVAADLHRNFLILEHTEGMPESEYVFLYPTAPVLFFCSLIIAHPPPLCNSFFVFSPSTAKI